MKIGIAFAGGGVRGAAHLGILQALEEHGIEAECYAGTSAGSIVATMKALGHSNEECLAMIESASSELLDVAYWDILRTMPGKFKDLHGVLKGERLRNWLQTYMGENLLLNVKHGLSIVSTDINTGAQVVFTSEDLRKRRVRRIDDLVTPYGRYTQLPLADIVYASCALPGIFRPLQHNSMTLVDGSITNNLPANLAKLMGADKVIAIDLVKRNPDTQKVTGMLNVLGQALNILIGQNTYMSLHHVKDVYRLNPDLTDVSLLDFDKARECYDAGYAYGKRIAPILIREMESQ